MHLAIRFFVFWLIAFVTLCIALILMNIFYNVMRYDLTLRSVRQELIIAGLSSLVEAAGAWAIISFLPAASRALAFPAIIVAFIYKLAHLEDWSRYDILLFFMFQIAIGASALFLFLGDFQTTLIILGVFGGFLALLAAFMRSI